MVLFRPSLSPQPYANALLGYLTHAQYVAQWSVDAVKLSVDYQSCLAQYKARFYLLQVIVVIIAKLPRPVQSILLSLL
jgi:hypothetical protein